MNPDFLNIERVICKETGVANALKKNFLAKANPQCLPAKHDFGNFEPPYLSIET